jgi:hypothetical protein
MALELEGFVQVADADGFRNIARLIATAVP